MFRCIFSSLACLALVATATPATGVPPREPLARLGSLHFRHGAEVTALAYSADGKLLALGGADHLVHLWNAKSGQRLATLRGHDGALTSIEFFPDHERLLTASLDGTVRLWSIEPVKEVKKLYEFTAKPDRFGRITEARTVCALARDGKTAVVAGPDRAVHVWDFARNEEVKRLPGHDDEVVAVAISPDGKFAASSAKGASVLVWDLAAGRKIHAELLYSFANAHLGAAFSPDGRTLAIGTYRAVRFLDLTSKKMQPAWQLSSDMPDICNGLMCGGVRARRRQAVALCGKDQALDAPAMPREPAHLRPCVHIQQVHRVLGFGGYRQMTTVRRQGQSLDARFELGGAITDLLSGQLDTKEAGSRRWPLRGKRRAARFGHRRPLPQAGYPRRKPRNEWCRGSRPKRAAPSTHRPGIVKVQGRPDELGQKALVGSEKRRGDARHARHGPVRAPGFDIPHDHFRQIVAAGDGEPAAATGHGDVPAVEAEALLNLAVQARRGRAVPFEPLPGVALGRQQGSAAFSRGMQAQTFRFQHSPAEQLAADGVAGTGLGARAGKNRLAISAESQLLDGPYMSLGIERLAVGEVPKDDVAAFRGQGHDLVVGRKRPARLFAQIHVESAQGAFDWTPYARMPC